MLAQHAIASRAFRQGGLVIDVLVRFPEDGELEAWARDVGSADFVARFDALMDAAEDWTRCLAALGPARLEREHPAAAARAGEVLDGPILQFPALVLVGCHYPDTPLFQHWMRVAGVFDPTGMVERMAVVTAAVARNAPAIRARATAFLESLESRGPELARLRPGLSLGWGLASGVDLGPAELDWVLGMLASESTVLGRALLLRLLALPAAIPPGISAMGCDLKHRILIELPKQAGPKAAALPEAWRASLLEEFVLAAWRTTQLCQLTAKGGGLEPLDRLLDAIESQPALVRGRLKAAALSCRAWADPAQGGLQPPPDAAGRLQRLQAALGLPVD